MSHKESVWNGGGGGGVTLNQVIDALYPVGSIYVSTLTTNPGTLLGRGTWTAFGAGRVMVGRDAGDPDFDTSEETGGAKTVASAGTVSQPTFSGNAATLAHSGTAVSAHSGTSVANHSLNLTHSGSAVADHAAHTHSVTSNVTVGNHSVTQPTIAWPAGVPTASGAAVADHASHTHTYTQVPNHVHVQRLQGGTTGSTTGTHLMGSTATGGSLRSSGQSTLDPTGGVATGTTNGPNATMTHSVTQPTIAWPAGVPTASGAAVDAHSVTNNAVTSGNPSAALTHSVTQPSAHTDSLSHSVTQPADHTVTQPNDHSYTPAGTVSQPTFTGSATSVVQPYIVVFMWKRTA